MKIVGDTVYIQRGEIWSLDFDVTDEKGRPYMLFSKWSNPYLAITVAGSMYEQTGDMRETHWLDLSHRWVEQVDGSVEKEPFKRFIATEPLYLPDGQFSVIDVLERYGDRIVIDLVSDFDIKNYLFYIENSDGDYEYKYVSSYTGTDAESVSTSAVWADYNFRVIKQFNTKSWMEQGYLYDAKILTGQTLEEYVAGILHESLPEEGWSDAELGDKISLIEDEQIRAKVLAVFESGMPLMPEYDVKALIIEPSKLLVSTNIQEGVR